MKDNDCRKRGEGEKEPSEGRGEAGDWERLGAVVDSGELWVPEVGTVETPRPKTRQDKGVNRLNRRDL